VLPQCGVLPNIHHKLIQKFTGKIQNQSTTPKPSISRATKKPVPAKATVGKSVLTKKGQGSFSVLGTPSSKVNLKQKIKIYLYGNI